MEIRYGRKRSGIRRQLAKKIEDWLGTITNEDVCKAAKRDVIVTGGSIASMLLGEKVNDYDIYFATKKTTEMVARYYVAEFNRLNQLDSVNSYTPEVRVEDDRVKIWLRSAGVAAEDQNYYEYFENRTEEETAEFAESLMEQEAVGDKPRYRPVFMSDNAISLSDKIQIVVRFFGSPDEIHANYDFAHAMNWYRYDDNHLELKAEALECLLSRTLVYRGSLYPIASIFRMKKFLERGWRITAGQQLKIMLQINELDLKDWHVLREQLIGVDMAYMWQLTEALREVDLNTIDSTYIAEIIDRIFE